MYILSLYIRQYLIVVIYYSREYTSCPTLVKLKKKSQNLNHLKKNRKSTQRLEWNTAQTYIFINQSTFIFYKRNTRISAENEVVKIPFTLFVSYNLENIFPPPLNRI